MGAHVGAGARRSHHLTSGTCIPDWDDDDPDAEALDQAHWEHFWDCQPCSYASRSGDLRSVTKISDPRVPRLGQQLLGHGVR
jgi:hypothetical protein